MHYEIAIPSYERPHIVDKATLSTLVRHGADLDRVTVWTATDEQREIYQSTLEHDVAIKTAQPGVMAARQHYHRHYPEGTRILNIDDDIQDLQQKDGDQLRVPDMTVDEIVELAFGLCEKTGARIWGIHPVQNGYFLRNEITVGLRYICGGFYGSFGGDREMLGPRVTDPLHSSGEDFELSLASFVAHGSVIRLEYLTLITKNFAKGGIDARSASLGFDRLELHRDGMVALAAAYPELSKVYTKAGDVPNLRLKTITHGKIPLEAI